MDVLADYLAKNPMASLMVHVAQASPEQLESLRVRLRDSILERRKKEKNESKTMKVTVASDVREALKYIEANHMRTLVFGNEEAILQNGGKLNTLVVRDDVGMTGEPLKEASSVLAALDRLFAPGPIPSSVVSAAALLAGNLQLMNQVRALIQKSA